MKLTEFLSLLGYGSKITVTTSETDEVIFSTSNFTVPYSVMRGYEDAIIQCFGCYGNRIIVWVTK